jgi:hypothetical protein
MSYKASLRIHYPTWSEPARLQNLLETLDCVPGLFEEVALFTAYTHTPMPLDELKRRAAQAAEVLPVFKARGLSAGINHLPTIGHLEENAPNALAEPWQRLVDKSGAVSAGCYCPADPDVKGYIRDSYTLLAAAHPDFIWVDDDLRLESHAPFVSFACFCPRCLEEFSAETGREWTRESLLAAFAGAEPAADRLALRRKWLRRNHRLVTDTLALIRKAVDASDPTVELGLMTAEINYTGYLDDDWIDAMAGPRRLPVRHRPGGGFYLDDVPGQLFDKLLSVGRQMAFLPDTLHDVQYEHENFPYQGLGKSRTLFTAEISGALGAGCTGAALNLLDICGNPAEEALPFLQAVAAMRPFHEQIVATCGRSPCEGFWTPFTPLHFAAMVPEGEWPGWGCWGGDMNAVTGLCRFGTPSASRSDAALGALLTSHALREWNAEELREILSKGVILDGPALAYLNAAGLGDLTGWEVVDRQTADMRERFTDDPLNGRFAGWIRDCRPSFWPRETHFLRATRDGARPLAEAADFSGQNPRVCEGVYENALGGRVAVLGYYPWDMIAGLPKVTQLQNLADWVTGHRLPVQITSFHRVAVWTRRDAQGRPAAVLLNLSNDAAEGVRLRVRHDAAHPLGMLSDNATWEILCPAKDWKQGEIVVTLPPIPAWHAALVRVP